KTATEGGPGQNQGKTRAKRGQEEGAPIGTPGALTWSSRLRARRICARRRRARRKIRNGVRGNLAVALAATRVPRMTAGPEPRGAVVWMTGLPSSGKSTLAAALQAALGRAGRPACTLDGDAVRAAIVPSPGYTPEARDAFYATLARLAALVAGQ